MLTPRVAAAVVSPAAATPTRVAAAPAASHPVQVQARSHPEPPVVSVVIPARNAAETLASTLEAVVEQTFDRWEAVVVDDGSSDGTSELAEDWIRREPRIR